MTLTDEQFVRVVLEEVEPRSHASIAHIVYFLQRQGIGTHFAFQFETFVGMRSAELEALVETERLRMMLGRNGLPEAGPAEVSTQITGLLARIPRRDDDLCLLAVADFFRWSERDQKGNGTLADLLTRVQPRLAPYAELDIQSIIEQLNALALPQEAQVS